MFEAKQILIVKDLWDPKISLLKNVDSSIAINLSPFGKKMSYLFGTSIPEINSASFFNFNKQPVFGPKT